MRKFIAAGALIFMGLMPMAIGQISGSQVERQNQQIRQDHAILMQRTDDMSKRLDALDEKLRLHEAIQIKDDRTINEKVTESQWMLRIIVGSMLAYFIKKLFTVNRRY